MSTMEYLFMQIFERSDWIADQLRQQGQSYNQSVASNLLAAGGRPPPWLWDVGLDGHDYGRPQELNREQLISGILYPLPRATTPSVNRSIFFSQPFLKEDNVLQSNGHLAETCALNKYSILGAKENAVLNSYPDGTQKENMVVDSLARIQRSKLRQKDLELRLGKKEKAADHQRKENSANEYTGRMTRSRAASVMPDLFKQSLEVKNLSGFPIEQDKKEKTADCPSKQKNAIEYTGRMTRSRSATVMPDLVKQSLEVKSLPSFPIKYGSRDTQLRSLTPRFDCVEKPSKSAKSLDWIDDENTENGPGIQMPSCLLQYLNIDNHLGDDANDTVGKQKCPAGLAALKLSSDATNAAHNAHSRLVETNSVASMPPPDVSNCEPYLSGHVSVKLASDVTDALCLAHSTTRAETFMCLPEVYNTVEPRQLVFDGIEEWHVGGSSGASLQKEKQGFSSKIASDASDAACHVSDLNMANTVIFTPSSDINTYVEPGQLEFDGIKERTHNDVVDAHLEKEKQSIANSNLELAQVSNKESVLRDSKKERDHFVTVKLNENLQSVEIMSEQKEGDRTLNGGQVEESCELLAIEESDHGFQMTKYKEHPPHVSFPSSKKEICGNSPTYTFSMEDGIPSHMESSGHHSAQEDVTRNRSSVLPQHVSERKCIENLIAEANSQTIEAIFENSDDGSGAPCSEKNGVLFEVKDSETRILDVANGSAGQQAITPNGTQLYNSMLEARYLTSSIMHDKSAGSSKSNSSVIPSYKRNDKFLDALTTGISGMTGEVPKYVLEHTTSGTDKIHNPLLQAYFLRSSTMFDENSGSHKSEISALSSSKKHVFLKVQETGSHTSMRDVVKKGSIQQAVTPDPSEFHNSSSSQYFLRRFTSLGRSVASARSSGSHDACDSRQLRKRKSHACEITWPKRTKKEIRSDNVPGTSPRLRLKSLLFNQDNDCHWKKRSESLSDAGTMLQHSLELNEVEKELSSTCDGCPLEETHQSQKHQITEGDLELKRSKHCVMNPLSFQHMHKLRSPDFRGEIYSERDLKSCLTDDMGVSEPTGIVLDLQRTDTAEDAPDDLYSANELEYKSSEYSSHFKKIMEESKLDGGMNYLFSKNPVRNSLSDKDISVVSDKTVPEFEGFSFDHSIIGNRIDFIDPDLHSVLEQLRRSMNILTPLPPSSTNYNRHRVPDIYQSLPDRLLKHMNLNDHFHFCGIDDKQIGATEDGKLTDSSFDGPLLGRTTSHSMPSSSTQFWCDVRKTPYTPPVKINSPRIPLERNGASSDKVGSNPELICFRIDENASTVEENINVDELEDTSQDKHGLREKEVLTNRKALVDVTSVYQNAPTMLSTSEKFVDRGSLDSVNTESYFGSQINDTKNLENEYNSCMRSKIGNKENPSLSTVKKKVQKAADCLHKRSSKGKVCGKASGQKRSHAILEKGQKASNIVCNVSSFIPLVHQKQQAAAPTAGKRDIKVKALEAAEVAKRLEEKKENERKMRKKASKLERIKLEQENLRQLELKQKQKEEERKKKEADIMARKRQREDEEKKEKQRKRRCMEETQRQRKEQEQRLRAEKEEKELRRKDADEKEHKRKELVEEAQMQHKLEKGQDIAGVRKLMEVDQSSRAAQHDSENLEACVGHMNSNDAGKAVSSVSNLQKMSGDKALLVKESRQSQSYEISPYRDSDDEEGEDDKKCKRKCIPSWARRKSLDQTLFSMRHIDAVELFRQKSFFDLNEVLSLRTRQPIN